MCCFPLTVHCTPVYLPAGKHMGLTWSVATPCLAQPCGLRAGCWMLLCRWQVFASRPCSAAAGTTREGRAARPVVGLPAAHLALHLLALGRSVTGWPWMPAGHGRWGDAGTAVLENLARLPAWHGGRRWPFWGVCQPVFSFPKLELKHARKFIQSQLCCC